MAYNQFSITEVKADYSNKQIVITTNFKLDASTVNTSTVELFESEIGNKTEYSVHVNMKTITIKFDDYPKFDTYYLKIEGIKDALQRSLSCFYSELIYFNSKIKDKLSILAPIHQETLNSKLVQFKVKSTEKLTPEYIYIVEVSDNISFVHNVKKLTANGVALLEKESESENDITFTAEMDFEGQVFARARVHASEEIFSDWSEIISFNIITAHMDSLDTNFMEDYVNTQDIFDEISFREIEPVEVLDKSELGTNDGVLYLEFNKDIKLPEQAEDEDVIDPGFSRINYIKLGVVTGFRKDMK